MSTTVNFATVIATLTPKDGSAPIQYKSDTTMDEEDILSEAQPAKERGRRFMSNDGNNSTTIQRYASNGKRDFNVFDGPIADAITGWAQQNPTKFFDFAFRYQYDEQDTSTVRVQYHTDCFIENTPSRVINNEVAIVKFTLNYGKLEVRDPDGNPV